MRTRWLDLALLALAIAAGTALRWVHLGTPSLWWDEVVDIAMAQGGGVADVLRVVRHGVPAGSANAGAMPLDYLLLHGWLAAMPAPRPGRLEAFFRFPAFVWSVAGLVALAGFARHHLGRDVGLVATVLLALSTPHVLYAAEVRWYSLLVLVTIVHLWAFARLFDEPADTRRWLVWIACAFAAVLTAVLSVVLLAAELLVVALRTRGTPRVVPRLIASAVLIGVLVAWLAAPSLGVGYGRPEAARSGLVATAGLVMRFLAWDDPVLLAAFAIALPLAWWDARAEGLPRPALLAVLALGFLAIPIVTRLADVKAYYVHPRHVIFLLPGFVILAAVGVVGACRRVVPARWATVAAVALVLATQAGTALRYVRAPEPFFARVKTLRDVRGVVEALRPATTGPRWLLLAERESMPNTVLTFYLRWYGLEDRVVFRGTRDVPEALRLLADRRAPIAPLAAPPVATIPVGLTPELRAFLRIEPDTGPPPASLAGATLVVWNTPVATPGGMPDGLVRRSLDGAVLFERAHDVPLASGAADG